MARSTAFAWMLVAPFAPLLVACHAVRAPRPQAASAAAAAATPAPSTLAELVAAFQAAHAAGDVAAATALAKATVPTAAELATTVRTGAAAEAFLAAYPIDEMPESAVETLGQELFRPGDPVNTVTQTHAATTEEIVAYREGSVAFAEFPGGMRRFAALAAPGRTWYVVELVPPGSSTGMKYTCFTRVGGRWIFLPKPWRAIPAEGR